MSELTKEQQEAVDAFAPSKVTNPATGQTEILLPLDDFDWIRALLGDEPEAPRCTDPRTGKHYALLSEGRYERFKAFFEEDPLTPAERTALLREAGKRAGWQNPEWDAQNGSQVKS